MGARVVRGLAGVAAAFVVAALAPATWAAPSAVPTARVVIRSSDVRGYGAFGTVADLSVGDLLRCFAINRLLAQAPGVGIAGTGTAHSDAHATTGASFMRGSVALNGEYDIESFAWLGTAVGEARGALAALGSPRFKRCLAARLRAQYGGPGEPARSVLLALSAPRVGDEVRAFELQLAVYSDASGSNLSTTDYDFDAVRVGRMVALLETDAAGLGPPSGLGSFPRALQVRLTDLLAVRMARAQGLRVRRRRPRPPRQRPPRRQRSARRVDLSAVGVLISESGSPQARKHGYFQCTASAVRSPAGNIVLSAGHCLWPMSAAAFAPGFRGRLCRGHYRLIGGRKVAFVGATRVTSSMPPSAYLRCGRAPHGIWTMTGAPLTPYRGSGAANGNRGRVNDFAFARMAPSMGRSLDQAVGGGLALVFAAPQAQRWRAYGLSKSDTLHYWTARARASALGPLLDCAGHPDLLIAGDSGGPWLDARGQIGAVNSQVSGNLLAGALLGASARRYYELAVGFTAGHQSLRRVPWVSIRTLAG
jgi:hypothetical protein